MIKENIITTPGGKSVNFIPSVAVAVTTHDTNLIGECLLFVGVR